MSPRIVQVRHIADYRLELTFTDGTRTELDFRDTVTLAAAGEDGNRRIRLCVVDTGPGIAPENQEKIFEKCWQIDSSVTREHSGSGLGLAISKELTQLLGGGIRVESEPGKGAAFIVVLPIECPETVHRPLPSLT